MSFQVCNGWCVGFLQSQCQQGARSTTVEPGQQMEMILMSGSWARLGEGVARVVDGIGFELQPSTISAGTGVAWENLGRWRPAEPLHSIAALRVLGKQPVDKEVVMKWVRRRRSGTIDWRIWEGIGSRRQVVGRWEVTNVSTSLGERAEKAVRRWRCGYRTGNVNRWSPL